MEGVVPEKTDDEIAQLKSIYQKNCYVIKSVGDFTYVITLLLHEQNVRLKFQLTASYPQVIPVIIIISHDLSPDLLDQLSVFLIEKANQSIGKSMIQDLVNEAIIWLRTNGVSQIPSLEKKSTWTKKKSKPEKKDINTEKHSEKKPSMRTATDVISRIQWDESLPTEDFLVGYLDRFMGMQEKPFLAFSWEDIASVDYNTLAIPKHRICYFKYKTVKIWEKALRLDLVFGSTGDTTCLADVMANYDNMVEFQSDNALSCESLASSLPDANLNFGNDFQNVDTQPNYFICLRIKDEDIWKEVAKLQEYVFQEAPVYEYYSVELSLLHVTLCTLRLKSPDQIDTAVQILESSKPDISQLVTFASPLYIADVNRFSNRIIYAAVETPPQYLQIVDLLESRFQTEGLLKVDHYKTKQHHMTLFKLSQTRMSKDYIKARNKQICERYSGYRFGKQNLDNLHLCPMDTIKQEDGFYTCSASLQL